MKTAVIYWSGTGNTEAMAQAVAEGMTAAGAEAVLLTPDQVQPGDLNAYGAIAPAVGAEQRHAFAAKAALAGIEHGLELHFLQRQAAQASSRFAKVRSRYPCIFVFCEQRTRLFLVAVDLPEPRALKIVRAVGDEALHVLRRVAEKQPHLVGELTALASFVCLSVSIV